MGFTALLRQPDFRLLFAGQALSMYGDSAMLLVLAIWVKELTGSNGAAGFTLVFVALPSLIGPLGGWVVDRVRRRPFLVITNLCSALAVLPLLAVHGRERVWLIYTVATFYGTLLVLHAAGLNALLKTLLPEASLGEANAVLQTAKEALRLVAPLTGAALYAVVGGGGVAVLDGVTFLAAALALSRLSLVEERPAEQQRTSVRAELGAGLRFLWEARPLLHVTIALALALLVIGIAESVVFAIVQLLGKPPEFVGVVVAIQGVGAVAGGFVTAWLIRLAGEVRVVMVGLTSFALGAAVMIVTWMPAVTVGVILAGFGLPMVLVGFVTVLQRTATGPLVGRVTTAAQLVIGVPQTVSVALGAVLVSVVDHRILLATMSAGTLLAVAYLLVTNRGRLPVATGAEVVAPTSTLAGGAVPGAMTASRALPWRVRRTSEPPRPATDVPRPRAPERAGTADEPVETTRTGTPP